jgi:arsenite methyltransferase
MKDEKELKKIVKEKYGEIARQADADAGCSCGCSCGAPEGPAGYTVMNDEYKGIDGYVPEADLNLGCGLPVNYAGIREGDTVVDLGSGAGNDVFIARKIVGSSGRVIGVDFTKDMIDKARRNNEKMGYANVEFRFGDIETLPLETETIDVIVSNCVLNLVPDKRKAFAEIFRVLKPGARFCVSDIVLRGDLPEKLRSVAEMYAGCVSGALQEEDYLGTIREAGFSGIEIQASKEITLPDSVLKSYLDVIEIALIRKSGFEVLSITVTGKK